MCQLNSSWKNGPRDLHVACQCSNHSFSAVASSLSRHTCPCTSSHHHHFRQPWCQLVMQSPQFELQMSQDLLKDPEDLEHGRHVDISQSTNSHVLHVFLNESEGTEVNGLSQDLLQDTRSPSQDFLFFVILQFFIVLRQQDQEFTEAHQANQISSRMGLPKIF